MTERRRLIVVVAVSAAAVVIAAVGAAAIGWMADRGETVVTQEPADESGDVTDSPDEPRSDDDPETGEPEADEPAEDGDDEAAETEAESDMFRAGGFVPEPMGGEEAIDALGDDIERVAKMNNRTVEELRELLLRDKTLHVTPSGFLMYIDTATPHDQSSD